MRIIAYLLIVVQIILPLRLEAHPMPNSLVFLEIRQDGVLAELQLPLSELQLAVGHELIKDSETLVARLGPQLSAYILEHVSVLTEGKHWKISVRDLAVKPVETSESDLFKEFIVHLWMKPPEGVNPRKFTFNYDVIIQHVMNHTALVSVRQDWDAGVHSEKPIELGVISLDLVNHVIRPMEVNQGNTSIWNGFKGMVELGISHIAKGTDHLLFLLVLLLPVPLLATGKKWSGRRDVKSSILHILKVVTAFTIGHSITLIIVSSCLLHLPAQPIEILIAVSILVSAVHAFYPFFPGRENQIAGLFGLVHGMAFAATIANLELDTTRMALSILGFNIGIELMQLFVIALIVPGLIFLSRYKFYSWVRIAGAAFASVAAIIWIVERASASLSLAG